MRQTSLRWTIFLTVLFVGVLVGGFLLKLQKEEDNSLGVATSTVTHPLFLFDEKIFYQGVNQAAEDKIGFSYIVAGGIVPHHNVASGLLANYFENLARQKPKAIILIGPNHEEVGGFNALTSQNGWETPFGTLAVDEKIASSLIEKGLVKEDSPSFQNEQSIGTIVPFIKYYLPETKIVPIILKSAFDKEDAAQLGTFLSNFLNQETIIIASVDFSHYLARDQAEQKDVVTLDTLKNNQIDKLFTLNSDYLDSPPTIATLLISMQRKSKSLIDVLYHTNSGFIQNNHVGPTTSYFVINYH